MHSSHKLAVFKGLYFCTDCGYTASSKAQKLVAGCGGATADGIQRVLRIRGGKLPSNLQEWPSDKKMVSSCVNLE